jgi:hypothetical protein
MSTSESDLIRAGMFLYPLAVAGAITEAVADAANISFSGIKAPVEMEVTYTPLQADLAGNRTQITVTLEKGYNPLTGTRLFTTVEETLILSRIDQAR